MFVGQIPRHWTENDLKKLFEEFGPVFQINILKNKSTQESRGKLYLFIFLIACAACSQNGIHLASRVFIRNAIPMEFKFLHIAHYQMNNFNCIPCALFLSL